MKWTQKSFTLEELYRMREKINLTPEYQRFSPIWKTSQKQKLLLSCVQGIWVPEIVLRETGDSHYTYETIDGQQRLKTIFEFREDRFSLPANMPKIPIKRDEYEKVAGKRRAKISPLAKDFFGKLTLDAVIIKDATESEAILQFQRLNSGSPLNRAEHRNCMTGAFRNVVNKLVKHGFFNLTPVSDYRGRLHTIVSQLLMIEAEEETPGYRGKDIDIMYQKYDRTFPADVAKSLEKKLDVLQGIFDGKKKSYMKKGQILNSYIMVSALTKKRVSLADPKVCVAIEEWMRTYHPTINQKLREADAYFVAPVDRRREIIEGIMKRDFPVRM